MNIFESVPCIELGEVYLRPLQEEDWKDLYAVYHDEKAVSRMNDDNCDFGFYCKSESDMQKTVQYWIEAYKNGWFVRLAITDPQTGRVVGTIEGFTGKEGVLRIDLADDFETRPVLEALIQFARENFYEYFGNEVLVIKGPAERGRILKQLNLKYIGSFRDYPDYFDLEVITHD